MTSVAPSTTATPPFSTPTSTPPDDTPPPVTTYSCNQPGETDDRCNGVFLRDGTIGTPEPICTIPREETRFDWCGENIGVFHDSGPEFFDEDSCGFQIELYGNLYTPEKLDPADAENACAATCDTSSITGFFLYQLPGCQ
ncbi:hypothetical protein G7054_g14969 [Neopestalotiopsis clavispora]|nr:hypothetical protein G7054_g14969 [Neopestalotiopsis clavispora]